MQNQGAVYVRFANTSELREEDGVAHMYVFYNEHVEEPRPYFSVEAIQELFQRLTCSESSKRYVFETAAKLLPKEKTERDLFYDGLYEFCQEMDTVERPSSALDNSKEYVAKVIGRHVSQLEKFFEGTLFGGTVRAVA